MTATDRWLLPEGVEELLPPDAWRAECLRRDILNLYRAWGYELIMPPMIEYLESLLTGTGNDLELQTFKLTDQLTGRLMGVRADMTPQAVRVDAHGMQKPGVTRLCYAGSVLHTRPANMMTGRSPIQVGCELFGADTLDADLEVMGVMLETLKLAGASTLHLDLSHVGIYRTLVDRVGLDDRQRDELHDAIERKSVPDLEQCLSSLPEAVRGWLKALVTVNGSIESIAHARMAMAGAPVEVFSALDQVEACAKAIGSRFPSMTVGFDLAELRGYNYHTGLVFTAYVPGIGRAVAQGGRYDNVGRVFGRPRPATGFSADLKVLNQLYVPASTPSTEKVIFAPRVGNDALAAMVMALRAEARVIRAVSDNEQPADLGCTHQLVYRGQVWQVEALSD